VTTAWAAVHVKDSYLQAQFHRLRSRRGAKKAILAVAASMLPAAYHMLKNGVEYRIWVPSTSRAGSTTCVVEGRTALGCVISCAHAHPERT
jgi:hypothetical protein